MGRTKRFLIKPTTSYDKAKFFRQNKRKHLAFAKKIVRPHDAIHAARYAWSPHYARDIKLINGVQRRSTKLVESVKDFFIGVAVLLLSL